MLQTGKLHTFNIFPIWFKTSPNLLKSVKRVIQNNCICIGNRNQWYQNCHTEIVIIVFFISVHKFRSWYRLIFIMGIPILTCKMASLYWNGPSHVTYILVLGRQMTTSYRVQCTGHVHGRAGKHVWASYQIRKIAVCTCAGNAGNVFPATDFKGN